MNQFSNRRGSNEEIVITELGQVGTQLDVFPHQTIEDKIYNCAKLDDITSRGGFTKFGVDKIGALITRGVLIDVAGLKGADMLSETYEITVPDLEQALQRQNLKLAPGDAIVIHTGWGKQWGKDNARYGKTARGSA